MRDSTVQHADLVSSYSAKLGNGRERQGKKGTIPSMEALVEVNGVLAGHHLVLAGAGAALLFS